MADEKEPESPQSDLFDYAKSIAAKDEGMARVDEHANPEWKLVLEAMVEAVCRERAHFTTDAVVQKYHDTGQIAETHDWRALGPVMKRCAKQGMCKKAWVPAVASARRKLHASPIQVWESLLFDPLKAPVQFRSRFEGGSGAA